MAILNYVRPQLTIEQILQVLPAGTVSRLTPIAIGPQYLLNRYGKETVPGQEFSDNGLTLAYKYTSASGAALALPAGHTVDLNSVKVYGENLEAELASFTGSGGDIEIQDLSNPNILRIDKASTDNFAGTGLHSSFKGRDVKVGDLVYVNDGNRIVKRTVVALRGRPVAATYGTNTAQDNSTAANSSYNPATLAVPNPNKYTVSVPAGWSVTANTTSFNLNVLGGSVFNTDQGMVSGEEYTISVQAPGTAAEGTARVNISSKSGLYSATNVTPTNSSGSFVISDAALAGATITITGTGGTPAMVAGQVFKVQVLAPYERPSFPNNLVISGTYTGTKDTTYLIKVLTGTTGDVSTGAIVQISDTAGIDEVVSVTLPADTNESLLGTFGLSFAFDVNGSGDTLAHDGLRAGDVYYVHAKAVSASTTAFNGILLDGPAVDTSLFTNATTDLSVRFRIGYSGEITRDMAADGVAWTATTSGITIDSNVALKVEERDAAAGDEWVPFLDSGSAMPPKNTGMLYASYRAVVPAPSNQDRVLIQTVSDITDKLGAIDMDNDLAFGANLMLSGANGKSIYALRTAGDSVVNYTAALRKLESTDSVYALCPLSASLEVQQAVVSHCESMSSKEIKNFRRAYVGTDSPGSYAVLAPATGAPNFTATVSDYNGQGNLLVTTTSTGVNFTLLDIGDGDRFLLTGAADAEYEISQVISATELVLKTGPVSAISPAQPFELWRADTPESQVDYVIQRSRALDSRRAVNVWVEDGTRIINGISTQVPNRFVAAEIAGLRCAVLPQQGLSMTEISSISDCPAMYIRYNRTDLNRAAAEGVFIITQEAESGTVFIRHQLTTDPNNGSLYYEDSAGVNIDDLSFRFKDVLLGYVGKKNVTADTLADIYNDCRTILSEASQTDRSVDYGPQLNGFESLTVEADPILKDRVNVYARVEIPLPLNQLAVTIEGTVDFDL